MVAKYVILYQMSLLFGFSLPMVLCSSIPQVDVAQDDQATLVKDAELEASLFQGDIILASHQLESPDGTLADATQPQHDAISIPDNKWSNAEVPYKLSGSFNSSEKTLIKRAIEEFDKRTCIRFIPYTAQSDYVDIKKGIGCYSYVGRIQTNNKLIQPDQTLSLGAACISFGIIIHELMHAVGFWHEQSRTDRDRYVTIISENILKTPMNLENNFNKVDSRDIQDLGLPYDYKSVMHYDKYAFTKDKNKPTILPKASGVSNFGGRDGFSELDVRGLNLLYNCDDDLAPEPSDCRDMHDLCSYWASEGECERKSKYMHGFCKVSCKKCGTGCLESEGFIKIRASSQCFKFYNHAHHTWEEAKAWCTSEGMALAKPEEGDFKEFQRQLEDALCPNEEVWCKGWFWLGGHGSGSRFIWDRDDSVLSTLNWYRGVEGTNQTTYDHPGSRVGTDFCLSMWPRLRGSYYSWPCTKKFATLCEVISA